MEENIVMCIIKKLIRYTVPMMLIVGIIWGVITQDFSRGFNLYITIFTKTFTPLITYVFEKKVEHTTEKMQNISDAYVKSLNDKY